MAFVKIGHIECDAVVSALSRSFEIKQSENMGRTIAEDSEMILDPKGTFLSYRVTFFRKNGQEDLYDELWDFLSEPRDTGVLVELPYNQRTETFYAYVTMGSQALKGINVKTGLMKWDKFEVLIEPMGAFKTL